MPCRRRKSRTLIAAALLCHVAAAAVAMPNLEAFVDGVVGAYMSQQQVAGAQVAVVRNGETLLVKGYGIDSVEPRRAVDPQRSLFRIGSISKTFTWLAIMQLAERGKLKLDGPINSYLPDGLDVPDDGFEQPIRVVDLMNHSAGFEDILQGLFVAEDARLLPLAEHLRKYRPRRVREPGKLAAYSNYSTALAGAIVANVTGMEFEAYVEQNILTPLGMTQTTFREHYPPTPGLPQPMPAELAANLAENIEAREGAWRALPHEHIVSMAPAGAAVSTAADMARYMLALLDPQRLEDAGVLRASTLAQMREPTFQSAPGMPAMHHGFFNTPLGVSTRLGFDNLSHTGSTLHFRSFMVVIPELAARPTMIEDAAAAVPEGPQEEGTLGIFVTANSSPGVRMVQAVPERILAEYFEPAPRVDPPRADGATERAREFTGQYRAARRSHTQFEKVLNIGGVPITSTPDGDLVMTLGGPTLRFAEIGKDLFRQPDGDATIAFARDDSGAVRHLLTPIGTFERVKYFQSMQWLSLMLLASLVTCIGILIKAALRRKSVITQTAGERRSARVMTGAAVAWLLFVVLGAAWIVPLSGPQAQDEFIFGYPHPLLKVALATALLATGLSTLGVATLVPVWRARSWPMARRLRHSVAVIIFAALVTTLLYWNVIGFRYF
jgi:CubicO group peptidase (beta-lactamase class C family)